MNLLILLLKNAVLIFIYLISKLKAIIIIIKAL